MSGEQSITTVGTDPKPAVASGGAIFIALFFGVIAAFLAGGIVASAIGVPRQTGMIVAGVAAFVLLEALFYVGNRRGPATFYRDRIEFHGDTVRYEDVSAAVRHDSFSHGLFGTADYELLAHGDENVRIRYATDPAEVERVLDGRLPDPGEQIEERSEVHDEDRRRKPRYLADRWAFWDYWEDEAGAVPDDPVIDADDLGDVLGVSVNDANLDDLDDVDMDGADGLGDIGAADVGADAGGDGGGFDGGGFDGGGGGGE